MVSHCENQKLESRSSVALPEAAVESIARLGDGALDMVREPDGAMAVEDR